MKRRLLNVQRISEEQLQELMHAAQGLRLRDNHYVIIAEDIDWYIVLYVLFEQHVIHKGQRPPYGAFEQWMLTHVTLYHAIPKAHRMSIIARRTADTAHPWESKHVPVYAVRKWQALYHYFTQLVTQAILLHE